MSSRRRASILRRQETRPITFKLNIKTLLMLPYRLCNPPPGVGKVRSCAVTPVIEVQLEDVLNRKHLPPLGLKDLEEWLLYIEKCPENLYFILWLKEYTAKYNQWALQSESHRSNASPSTSYRVTWPIAPTSSSLALFYARAKQTFFTPNRSSPYELNISSDLLSPFHTSNFGSPHPDPVVFTAVAVEVQKMLKESLDRMAVAAYANMGTDRTVCGIIGGFCVMLLGSIAPLVVNFSDGRDRWLRLLAIPGMWFGLTAVLTSLHGVCLIVYVFGDFRQLRKFELSRPPISHPRTLSNLHSSSIIPPSGPVIQPLILPIPHPPHLGNTTSPQPAANHESSNVHSLSSPTDSLANATDLGSESASVSSSPASEGYDDAALTIEIGPAYYDDSVIEGPATGFPTSIRRDASLARRSIESNSCHSASEFIPTASFIYPYHPRCVDGCDSVHESSPEERQGIGSFDFDLLPNRSSNSTHQAHTVSVATHGITEAPSMVEPNEGNTVAGLNRPDTIPQRVQHKCNKEDTLTNAENLPPPSRFLNALSPSRHPPAKLMAFNAVPAFASPFTRVLSPVVTRAQWEVVVKSVAVAGVACWTIVGCLLAIPVGH